MEEALWLSTPKQVHALYMSQNSDSHKNAVIILKFEQLNQAVQCVHTIETEWQNSVDPDHCMPKPVCPKT